MYCMTITYPKTDGAGFDMDYYRNAHLPLCARLLAEFGYRGVVLRENQGSGPGSGDLNYASLDILFDNADQMQAGLAKAGDELAADVANFTNIEPQMVFGEVDLQLD